MQQDVVDTFTATIYIGLKERCDSSIHSVDEVRSVLQSYVDKVGLCVTLTPTEFIYSNGNELGVIIGLINYPRFPQDNYVTAAQAIEIARKLMLAMGQTRVSVVFPDRTVMLTNPQVNT